VWGNVNGKTVRIKSGGGEIGEYNATNDMMAFTAGEVKGLAAGVAALIGVAAALFELLK
jgi:ATP-dependent protease ClpP protease subunit